MQLVTTCFQLPPSISKTYIAIYVNNPGPKMKYQWFRFPDEPTFFCQSYLGFFSALDRGTLFSPGDDGLLIQRVLSQLWSNGVLTMIWLEKKHVKLVSYNKTFFDYHKSDCGIETTEEKFVIQLCQNAFVTWVHTHFVSIWNVKMGKFAPGKCVSLVNIQVVTTENRLTETAKTIEEYEYS